MSPGQMQLSSAWQTAHWCPSLLGHNRLASPGRTAPQRAERHLAGHHRARVACRPHTHAHSVQAPLTQAPRCCRCTMLPAHTYPRTRDHSSALLPEPWSYEEWRDKHISAWLDRRR